MQVQERTAPESEQSALRLSPFHMASPCGEAQQCTKGTPTACTTSMSFLTVRTPATESSVSWSSLVMCRIRVRFRPCALTHLARGAAQLSYAQFSTGFKGVSSFVREKLACLRHTDFTFMVDEPWHMARAPTWALRIYLRQHQATFVTSGAASRLRAAVRLPAV